MGLRYTQKRLQRLLWVHGHGSSILKSCSLAQQHSMVACYGQSWVRGTCEQESARGAYQVLGHAVPAQPSGASDQQAWVRGIHEHDVAYRPYNNALLRAGSQQEAEARSRSKKQRTRSQVTKVSALPPAVLSITIEGNVTWMCYYKPFRGTTLHPHIIGLF